MINLNTYTCLSEAFEHTLMEHPNATGLIEVNRETKIVELSYQKIHQKAVHVSKLLQQQEFNEGDRCALIMTNQSKWNLSGIGVFYAGGVLVPLDYKLGAMEQVKLLLHAKVHSLIIEFPLWFRMIKENLIDQLAHIHIFVTEVPDDKDIGFAKVWEQDTDHLEFQMKHRNKDDIATIVYSSGTYGRAKGCMLTHNNYLSQGQALAEMYPVDETHTYFSFIPTNHAIDFMCGFFLPIVNGSKTVHQRTLRPEFIASTINQYQVTHMALVPMLLKNLQIKLQDQFNQLPKLKSLFLHSMIGLNRILTKNKPRYGLSKKLLAPVHKKFGNTLQYIFVGGAFTEPELAQFFYNLGFSVAIGYGLTEAGTVVAVNDLAPFTADTVGKPLPITKVKLKDSETVAGGSKGEIMVSGPTVMKGYFEDDDLTSETIKEGWLSTGDIGVMTNTGYLKIVGRKKNMIVTSGGKNIYPEDVEHQFQHIGLEEYCVFAGSYLWGDSSYHDDLILVVRPKENTSYESIKPAIVDTNQKLADYKRIAHVLVWPDEFPKTATFKIKRPLLAQNITNKQSPSIDHL